MISALALVLAAAPAECRVGAFVYGLSQFNVAAQTVDVDLYVWVSCPKGTDKEAMKLAVVGASNEVRDDLYEDDIDDRLYRYERIRATLRVAQDLRKYPFDLQKVFIDLESSRLSVDNITFTLDDDPAMVRRPKCCIDDSVQLSEWTITEVLPAAEVHAYETRFGIHDPTIKAQSYARLSIDIVAERIVAPYLLKVLFPLFLILAVAYLTWWFKPDDVDAVTSLLVTCLLAAVALHLAQATSLPNVGYLVMSDWFFLHAYAMLLVMLGLFTAGYRWSSSEQAERAVKLQRAARAVLPVLLVAGWVAPIALR